jgi:hypothetical protein
MEKQQLASSAGVIALLALLVHAFGPSSSERRSDSAESGPAKVSKPASGSTESDKPSIPRPGPWRATQQYFHASPEGFGDQSTCLARPTPRCAREILLAAYGFPAGFAQEELHSIIVTIPDPLHTRMATETDRGLDAVQQAAFRSGWELATQWLPWTAKVQEENATGRKSKESFDVEKLPGLLVFRKHFDPYTDIKAMLLVFVVGETPTAGVNGFQFEHARQTVTLLGTAETNTLYIAGPNFSGSFQSLTRLLEADPGRMHFEIRSGSVSNSDYARAMLLELESRNFAIDGNPPNRASVTFHGSTLPSVSFRNHFVRLAKSFRLRADQTAELVEDETGFSHTDETLHVDRTEYPITTYRYPRDIAQLRNAYNDAAFAVAQKNSPGEAQLPTLEFSLKDTQSGEGVFPMFSSSHTPVSQNAQLQNIIDVLNRKSIRLVSLSATNVFDSLFLANLLTKKCPDTRIVLRGADLLFVQQASQGGLSGIMAISPFPLFDEGTEWSLGELTRPPTLPPSVFPKPSARDAVTFATSDQIGEFDAVLALLSHGANASSRQPFYSTPDMSTAAWVLVLGHAGWLPVDLYGQTNQILQTSKGVHQWFNPSETKMQIGVLPGPLPKAGQGWITLSVILVVFSIAFCARLIALKFDPRNIVWSTLCLCDLDSGVRRQSINDIVHSRYLCMMSCFASLVLANGLLLCPMLAAHLRYGGSVSPTIELLVALAFLATAACTAYLMLVVPVRICRQDPLGTCPLETRIEWWSLALRGAIVALAAVGLYVWWTCCDNGSPGALLCLRTIQLASPVCPMWPLLFATCGLFALAYFHLRRFTWGDRRQPHLETSLFDQALCNEFSNLKGKLDNGLLHPFRAVALRGVPLLVSIVSLSVLSFWILFPIESLRSFEPPAFSHVLRMLLLFLAVFTLLSFVRFVRCWSILRAFLVSLNSVVLGRFFFRIPEFGGTGPIWIREVKLMSLATAVNSAIALHNLQNVRSSCNFTAAFAEKLRRLLSLGNRSGTRMTFIQAYADFRRTAGEIMQTLGETVLHPYWRKNKLPFVGGTAEDIEEAEPVTKAEVVTEQAAAATVGSGSPVRVTNIAATELKMVRVTPLVLELDKAEENGPE